MLWDRFRNRVTDGLSTAMVAASGSGPGPLLTTVSIDADGCPAVAFLARTAGTYSLSLLSVASGEPLPGSPLQVCCIPLAELGLVGGALHSCICVLLPAALRQTVYQIVDILAKLLCCHDPAGL